MGQINPMDEIIELYIPPELIKYRGQLKEFFKGMIVKLSLNSHKATPEKEDMFRITALLLRELAEFLDEVSADRTNKNTLYELYDTANFAFLAFVALKPGINGDNDGKE